jgi:hypothetical protein
MLGTTPSFLAITPVPCAHARVPGRFYFDADFECRMRGDSRESGPILKTR